jgi:hypothetical protein
MAGPLSPVTDVIKLAEFVGKAVGAATHEIDVVASAVGTSPASDIQHYLNTQISHAVIAALITKPLKIEGVINDAQAQGAVATLESITSLILSIVEDSAVAAQIAKLALGNHGGEGAFEIISRIPQELGLNFFIGSVMHSLTMLAIEQPLLEAINIEHRPTRIDFRILRLMLRQHLLTPVELSSWLVKLGYPDDLISKLIQLADVNLTAGEITSALAHGTMTEQEALAHLEQAGYTVAQANILIADAHKTNNASASRYRAAARSSYTSGHITETQFRAILSSLGVAATDINYEIAAGQLEHHAKNLSLTLGELKLAFQHGDLAEAAAITKLLEHGYSQPDAQFIINTWTDSAGTKNKGVSENRILAYMQSGVLTPQDAYNRLTSMGVRPEDAHLLVNNPSASGSVYRYNLDPKLVQTALKDGVISVDEANKLLNDLHVNPDEISILIQIATTQTSRAKRSKNNPKVLGEGTIKTAFENGIMTEAAAHRYLSLDGYSDNDATIIIATWYAGINGKPPDGWVTII